MFGFYWGNVATLKGNGERWYVFWKRENIAREFGRPSYTYVAEFGARSFGKRRQSWRDLRERKTIAEFWQIHRVSLQENHGTTIFGRKLKSSLGVTFPWRPINYASVWFTTHCRWRFVAPCRRAKEQYNDGKTNYQRAEREWKPFVGVDMYYYSWNLCERVLCI